jgi:TrmH family RNA methyltransferase
MHDIKLETYKKSFEYSYSFGMYPTLELLRKRPKAVLKLIIHPKQKESIFLRELLSIASKFNIDVVTSEGFAGGSRRKVISMLSEFLRSLLSSFPILFRMLYWYVRVILVMSVV